MPLIVQELNTRNCFVPRPGFCFVEADIAGLEGVTLAQCEIWTINDRTKADQINAGIDLLSVTGAAIAGEPYATFMPKAKGVGRPKDPEAAHIRNLSKVPVYGKPGGMANRTLVGFARTSYGIRLGQTASNPWPTREQQLAEADRIGGFWEAANPNDVEYLNFIRSCRRGDRYEVIIGHPSVGSVVRRGKATYCAACNSLFQGLGALAAGEITWEVVKACYGHSAAGTQSPLYGCRLVMHAYDSWLLEVPLGRQTAAGHELVRIIKMAARRKIPDVTVKAEPVAMAVWDKAAETVIANDTGELLIWGTPECQEYLAESKPRQAA
ncbi:MAG: hypothetical protein V4593_08050 [Pseudomonadota bacterium]